MDFHAETVALQLVAAVHPLVERLRRNNAKLADQAERAADSIALNAAEGRGRRGRDRAHHFAIGYASGRELRMALALAEAKRALGADELAPARALLDRELAMLWRLSRR